MEISRPCLGSVVIVVAAAFWRSYFVLAEFSYWLKADEKNPSQPEFVISVTMCVSELLAHYDCPAAQDSFSDLKNVCTNSLKK